jgi:hypothetical protein
MIIPSQRQNSSLQLIPMTAVTASKAAPVRSERRDSMQTVRQLFET